jgi:hypothetical protein
LRRKVKTAGERDPYQRVEYFAEASRVDGFLMMGNGTYRRGMHI